MLLACLGQEILLYMPEVDDADNFHAGDGWFQPPVETLNNKT